MSRISTNGAASFRSREPLEETALRRYAPSVYAETAHSSRSTRFVPIPTISVIEALHREGFQPFHCAQAGTRDSERRGFVQHTVRLRHPTAPADRRLGDLSTEIVISNANDGGGAFRINAGLFRLVCLNGMTVHDSTVASGRVVHSGRPDQVVADVVRESLRVVSEASRAIDGAHRWAGVTMSAPQQVAFAREAIALRWPDPETRAPIGPEEIAKPRRELDRLPDLWHVFNRVQENIIKGGQGYMGKAQHLGQRAPRRHVRPVMSIDDDRRINQQLWAMADATAQALTAR